MTQLLTASTLFQVASLAAMLDAGALPATPRERVLVIINGTRQPELTERIQDAAGFDGLAARFDRVLDLGELFFPRRPAQFSPREDELYLWERLLRGHLGLGSGSVQLVVDTIQANPTRALCRIFHDAPIVVHSDGLMSYGPTRNTLPPNLRQRLDGVAYLDLVPGLKPLLLREFEVPLIPVPTAALASIIAGLAEATPIRLQDAAAPGAATVHGAAGTGAGTTPALTGSRSALLLGQYLSQLGLLTEEEEEELHRDMVFEAHRRGADSIVFKPHPSAGPGTGRTVARVATGLGMAFRLLEDPMLAETTVAALRPALVVSCFSTALVSVHCLFGTECAAVGTGAMLERLAPYENSNRIPITLIDALFRRGVPVPDADPRGNDGELARLVTAVGYCMQPQRMVSEEESVRAFLATGHQRHAEYFKRRRLTRLALPGGLPPRPAPLRLAMRLNRRLYRLLPGRLNRSLNRMIRRLPRTPLPRARLPRTPLPRARLPRTPLPRTLLPRTASGRARP